MRHDRGTQYADRDVQRLLTAQHIPTRFQPGKNVRPERLDQDQFDGETGRDGGDQPQHNRFQTAGSLAPCNASTISVSKAVSATPVVIDTPSSR